MVNFLTCSPGRTLLVFFSFGGKANLKTQNLLIEACYPREKRSVLEERDILPTYEGLCSVQATTDNWTARFSLPRAENLCRTRG